MISTIIVGTFVVCPVEFGRVADHCQIGLKHLLPFVFQARNGFLVAGFRKDFRGVEPKGGLINFARLIAEIILELKIDFPRRT